MTKRRSRFVPCDRLSRDSHTADLATAETKHAAAGGRIATPSAGAEVKHVGLQNKTGANNCFLNVVIQALWHLDAFRCVRLSLLLLPLLHVIAAVSAACHCMHLLYKTLGTDPPRPSLLPQYREGFKTLDAHSCPDEVPGPDDGHSGGPEQQQQPKQPKQHRCLFCALKLVFRNLEHSNESLVSSEGLREACVLLEHREYRESVLPSTVSWMTCHQLQWLIDWPHRPPYQTRPQLHFLSRRCLADCAL